MAARFTDGLRSLRLRFPLPPRTVRLSLTVLYGGLFLASGAGLLALTYGLMARRLSGPFSIHGGDGGPGPGARLPGGSLSPSPVPSPGRVTLPSSLVTQAAADSAAALHQLLIQSGIALAVMAVVSIGLGYLVAGRVLRPLRTITTAVRDISATNLHQRLALAGPDDELKELGNTFDGLLERLERSFAAQRQFVANASHELRTPLARQRTLAEVALSDPQATAGSLRTCVERVLTAAEQQEQLIEALLTLARSERGLDRRDPFDLAAVTYEVLLPLSAEAESHGLHVVSTLRPAPASGDSDLVERLVANLVRNAVRHNVAEGRVEVMTGSRAGRAMFSVANTEPMVPAGEVDRLFRPFERLGGHRAAQPGGLGLGLSIVQAIVTAHGATLTVRPRPEGGLHVEVNFPGTSTYTPSINRPSAQTRG
jgi:signal transduction histidine kinase